MENVSQWAVAMQQTGPFFVSILFLVVIATWARVSYRAVCERKEPRASKEELHTHRGYFIYAVVFGSLMTIAAMIYWFVKVPVYTFTGQVRNLGTAEALWGDSDDGTSTYIRPIFLTPDPDGLRRNDSFIIVSRSAFSNGQEFSLQYQKAGGRIEELTFTYEGKPLQLAIQFDEKTQRNVLVPIGRREPRQVAWSLDLIGTAYAQTNLPTPQRQQQPAAIRPTDVVSALQSERLFVGSEITAIRAIAQMSPGTRNALVASEGPHEPMVITLLDLKRHSDRELSYNAATLLRPYDTKKLIAEKLQEPSLREQYKKVLYRIPPADALAIIRSLPSRGSDLTRIKDELSTKTTPRLLAAIPSSEGDRFWMTVDLPAGPRTSACVQSALGTSDHVKSGGDSIVSGSRRATYSYSKSWVLEAADKVERCGAKVTNFSRS